MEEQELYYRYYKFREAQFGPDIPETEKATYLQDLLKFQESFVVEPSIGYVGFAPFSFDVFDNNPVRQKPFPYPHQEREWIRRHTEG